MNITRYKWPAVVAASLHGALFVAFPPDSVSIFVPEKTKAPEAPPPLVIPVELTPPEAGGGDAGDSHARAQEAPTMPDIPSPADLKPEFTVPVVDASFERKPLTTLIPPATGLEPGDGSGTRFGTFVSDPGTLDRTPRAIAQPEPGIPYEFKRSGSQGSVTVEFIVGVDGRVLSAEASKWSHRELVDPAVRAVYRWKFEPGTVQGRKVRFRMAVPIEFNLNS